MIQTSAFIAPIWLFGSFLTSFHEIRFDFTNVVKISDRFFIVSDYSDGEIGVGQLHPRHLIDWKFDVLNSRLLRL